MKINKIVIAIAASITFSGTVLGGNPDRAGGAGGTQLLINPFGRSAGSMGSNTAYLRGAEAMQFNVGGLGFTPTMEIMASTVVYLQGTGINLSNASLAVPMGETGENVLGISVSAMQFGDINITSQSQPDGTLGTYTPQFLNLGFAYARKFSNSIAAGILVRYVTEGLSNVTASGLCFDMGVQYQTALNPKNKIKKEDFRFGMSVRNLGSDLNYTGSGLSLKTNIPTTGGGSATRTTYFAGENFNLPALVNIGVAYDIRLDKNENTYYHRLTPSGNFNYNAFAANMAIMGIEYSFKEMFMVRGGYGYQGTNTGAEFNTQYYGYSGGFSVQMPITKDGMNLGIDYAYAPTRVFNGIHNVTLRITLGSKKN